MPGLSQRTWTFPTRTSAAFRAAGPARGMFLGDKAAITVLGACAPGTMAHGVTGSWKSFHLAAIPDPADPSQPSTTGSVKGIGPATLLP